MTKKNIKPERKNPERKLHENDIQRIVLIGTLAVVIIVVGVIGYALVNEFAIKPNKILVTVNEREISVKEFQEYARFNYALNYGSYTPEQLMQFGISFDPTQFSLDSLNSMIEDTLIEGKAAEMGVEISRADAEEWIELALGYDSGDPEPTATSTLSPTQTLAPTATSTFVFTPTVPPTATLAPDITPTAPPVATSTPEDEADAPAPTIEPTSAPLTEDEFTETFNQQISDVAGIIGLSETRVRELWIDSVYHYLLKEELADLADLEYETTKVMVHAAHILIKPEYEADATEEEIEEAFNDALALLQAAKERIDAGDEFEVVAAELSQDTSAYKGGDLGWSSPDYYVTEFADAVTTQVVGIVGEPVRTTYGWHLIKVYDRKVVDLSQSELDLNKQSAFTELVDSWVASSGVDVGLEWINYIPDFPR